MKEQTRSTQDKKTNKQTNKKTQTNPKRKQFKYLQKKKKIQNNDGKDVPKP